MATERKQALKALEQALKNQTAVRDAVASGINSKPHTIAIFQNMTTETPPREVFQWKANTGEPYSPAMSSLEDCQQWPLTNGLNPQFE